MRPAPHHVRSRRFPPGTAAGIALLVLLGAARLEAARPEAGELDHRSAPETWNLWRCGPFPFPDTMEPRVPEAVAGATIDFGPRARDLAIVVPEIIPSDYDGRALQAMIRLIRNKAPQARVVTAAAVTPEIRRLHLLVLGTWQDNSLARVVLGEGAGAFLAGTQPGGYRVSPVDPPFPGGRRAILALGVDPAGAWAAAGVLAYAIHPEQKRLTEMPGWPVRFPAGVYWSAFDARCPSGNRAVTPPPRPEPAPRPPRVPFGVRIWGSPMPTLGSFQRLVHALHGLGINTIAIQGGGWPDLPSAADYYRTAVDLAWREGIFTILYVGNEMAPHRPAPLTANHRAIVNATKDLPGLLEWHLYNQLAADLDAGERRLVEEQMHWLQSVSSKRIGVEVVWGHDTVAIPAEKARLLRELKQWGMGVVAHDDAPIGGWSRQHDPGIWEPRLRQLEPLGLPVEAVLQAHVPFVEPELPTPAQVRNQFWWAVAGGAKGFLFETACLFTHVSLRGLLGWDLQPLPDGRYAEIRRLAQLSGRLETMIADTSPASSDQAGKLGLQLEPDASAALRVRRAADGRIYVLLINPSTTAPTDLTLALRRSPYRAAEIAPGGAGRFAARTLEVHLDPGDGACFELTPAQR